MENNVAEVNCLLLHAPVFLPSAYEQVPDEPNVWILVTAGL